LDGYNQSTAAPRPVLFARHARAAIEKNIPEARAHTAHWSLGTNEAWVRFTRPDGLYGYFALRRHLDWVSGEAGLSRKPCQMVELSLVAGRADNEVTGYRVRLGELIHGRDRWWPTGDTSSELEEQLNYLALQLGVKGGAHFRRWPGSHT
jgi:hypothetical protein